jgi:ribosomal protein S18 acetylase RimI-like enzyme
MKLTPHFSRVAVSQEGISLGDGLILKEKTNPNFVHQSSEWELFRGDDPKRVGYVATYIYPNIGHTIAEIRVDGSERGKGLGEQMVRALAQHYGSLSSDPQANTSNAAVRMWQRMGAEKVPTNKNSKGYFYQLTK